MAVAMQTAKSCKFDSALILSYTGVGWYGGFNSETTYIICA
jgi:hypothetical protein